MYIASHQVTWLCWKYDIALIAITRQPCTFRKYCNNLKCQFRTGRCIVLLNLRQVTKELFCSKINTSNSPREQLVIVRGRLALQYSEKQSTERDFTIKKETLLDSFRPLEIHLGQVIHECILDVSRYRYQGQSLHL